MGQFMSSPIVVICFLDQDYRFMPDYLRRSVRVCRFKKVSTATTMSKMQVEQSILSRIQRRKLKWYGRLHRMRHSGWPKKIYRWTPRGRKRRVRPQHSWKNQVTDFMRSRNMEKDMSEFINPWHLGMDRQLLLLLLLLLLF